MSTSRLTVNDRATERTHDPENTHASVGRLFDAHLLTFDASATKRTAMPTFNVAVPIA